MSTKITGQRETENIAVTLAPTMGVASPSTKRRLEAPEGDEVVSAKIAKKLNNNNNDIIHCSTQSEVEGQDTTANENSSDFLTTSILARTLLTSSTVTTCYAFTSDPLESLKSSLEALPAPAALDSCDQEIRPLFLYPTKPSIHDLEFTNLLCHERPLGGGGGGGTTVTVLSPIDDSTSSLKEWSSSPSGPGGNNKSSHQNGTSLSSQPQHQVITEDENGKSYFNLGSAADATIVARKSSYGGGQQNGCIVGGQGQQLGSWNNNCGNGGENGINNDFDDNASSSSCESISSEDLFNSGEEFDPSDDDEDELCSYKQQRSTVLHLSLCKLNKFRTQQCVEPSLHRSVLICNTLRSIEQEIKTEDEVDESLKSQEKLPSFWRSTSNHCFSSGSSSQPQITDTRPSPGLNTANALMSPNGHDPYLSPNPYNTNSSEAPYMSYDYSNLRPTPYHTTSYEYEHDLPSSNSSVVGGSASPASQGSQPPLDIASVTSTSSVLLECDSGYGEDLHSYYYAGGTHTQSSPGSSPTLMDTSGGDFMNSPTSNGTPSPVVSVPPSGNNRTNNGSISPPYHLQHCVNNFSPGVPSATSPEGESVPGLTPPTVIDQVGIDSDMSDSTSSMSNPSSSPPLNVNVNCLLPGGVSPPLEQTSPPSPHQTAACDYLGSSRNLNPLTSTPNNSSGSGEINGQSSLVEHHQMCWSKGTQQQPQQPSLKEPTLVTPQPLSLLAAAPASLNGGPSPGVTFAQQDSQCGLESRRSDLSISNHFNNHNLPMENLISSTYSSSL